MRYFLSYITDIAESKAGRFFIILLIVFIFYFRFEISYNEMDVIPYAFSFFNREWISNDWYLNQAIPYRYLFNYLAGWMVDVLGFIPAIFIGRIITYILFSYAIYSLINSFRSSQSNVFFLLALTVQFTYFSYGIGAGEWMVGGFDTKVFAYAFILLSFNAFLNGKLNKGWLFGGLALSFHVLIGLYHLICLIPIVVANAKRTLSISMLLYPLGGIFGVLSIIYYLYDPIETLNNSGFEAYVNISVPHHTIPSVFPDSTWIYLTIFTCCNLLIIRFIDHSHVRPTATYILVSVACFLFGLIVFFISGPSHYLRYYFFRYSDILLPFFTLLMIAWYADMKIKNRTIGLISIVVLSIGLLLLPKVKHRIITFAHSKREIRLRTSQDLDMENWIKKNTAIDDMFITNPNDKYFYLNYERPVFALTRQSPQSGLELNEWYQRLKLLNGNKDLHSKEEVIRAYQNMTCSDVELISVQYPEVSYLLMSKPNTLELPIYYQTDKLILYGVNSKECP